MKIIGKYQIQGEIGHGGFGTVYRAWDPTVNRAVAIKVLTVQGDEDLLVRFRNEAAAAGNLHHRNIVTVHDFGEHDGVPYMVMQLLEGNTLQEAMTKKLPYSLIQKMNFMGQVAEGLHHAHMHGIVHRDVKPPNIMIMPDESVQIMDFGIARVTANTSRQTRTGFVIGTVLYMAPEQFLPNKVIDHRADIWSYGVIYYEFLTGRHPFAAPEETSVLYQIAHVEPPPLRSVAPDCPQALEDIITRLLQKDPDLRYQKLKEVQFDVQPILVDLKRERAQELVAEVSQLVGEGRVEEAQAAVQGILELDPSNREAQSLLQQVRQRLQRRLIQPRINAMLQKAEQDVQSREFQAAIDSLESALRLSGTDPAIEGRLSQVRNLYDHSRRAERLVADAQREMRARNYTAAFRIASEAAQTDPGNTSASHLISQIQHELDLRERQRQLDQGINRARGLLLLQQYEEAITALDSLASDFPDDATVADLLAAARREKQQQERLERRRKEIAQVRETLRQHKFESGITTLEMLLAEFPSDPEIRQLLSFARDEWQAHNRAQHISRTRAEADRLCNEGRFDEALGVVEQALGEYPGDASLVRLVQSVTLRRTEYEERQRTLAIRGLLQEAIEVERKGDAAGALRLLEQGLVDYKDAEALTSAAGRLRHIVAQQERRDALARQSAAVEAVIASGDYPRAMSMIDAARREFPGERVFDGLASRAAAARTAAELEMARARVRKEIDEGHRDLALELIAVALKRFPGDAPLKAMERETRAAIAAAEQKAAEERRAREDAERRAREDRERRAKEEAKRKAREEAERRAAEQQARIDAERIAREEVERLAAEQRLRVEAERKAREEAERRAVEERAQLERERKAREEFERKAREEAERRAAEERLQLEREWKAREEAERKGREQAAQIAAEQAARVEAERKAREEAERIAAEERKAREELDRKARAEAERFAAEQRAYIEVERRAREAAEQSAAEQRAQLAEERKAREELEQRAKEHAAALAFEQRARIEAERKAREEAERLAAEQKIAREAAERKAREEAAAFAADQETRFAAERRAREEAERLAAEQKIAREAAERRAREEAAAFLADQKARFEAEHKAREEAERLAAEQKIAREAVERKVQEQSAAFLADQKARFEAERKAREEAERLAAEQKIAREAADRKAREEAAAFAADQKARFDAERKAREEAERLAAEQRTAREAAERKAREEAAAFAAEQKARLEAERKARQEAERLAAELRIAREAAERRAREEAAVSAAHHKARLEAERKAREEAERLAAEQRRAREAAERKAREEAERRAVEDKTRLEAEKKAREEMEKRANEQRALLERERRAREEAERRAAEERARSDKERKAREEAEKKVRKAGAAAAAVPVGVGDGTAAAPAPIQAVRKPQLPLYLAGAAVAVLVLAGAIVALGHFRQPAEAPVAEKTTPSVPPAKPASEPPASERSRDDSPQNGKPVQPAPSVPAAKTRPEPPKVGNRATQLFPPEQVAGRRQEPPPGRVEPGGPREIGDSGGRPPVVVQPAPVPPPTEEPSGPWQGRKNGKLVWYGQLPPGGRLVLSPQGLIEGPCCARIDLLPGFAHVNITGYTPDGKLNVTIGAPNSLIIQNKSQETVSSIEVHWRVKQ